MATRPIYTTRPKGKLHCEGHLVEFRQGRACPACSKGEPLLVPATEPARAGSTSGADSDPPTGGARGVSFREPTTEELVTQDGRIRGLAWLAAGIGDRLDKEQYQAIVCKRQLYAAIGEEQRDRDVSRKLDQLTTELAELSEKMNRGASTGIEPPPAQDTTAGRVH